MSARTVRRRIRVHGVVQGVGFRPHAHRLATELRLTGHVGNDTAGVFIEVEGDRLAVDAFEQRLAAEAPRSRPHRRRRHDDDRSDRRTDISHRRERRRVAGADLCGSRHRRVRRLLPRVVRSRRPPLPLPLHQLHELRPALHDHGPAPVRPAQHDDGGLRDVPGLQPRVPRSRGPTIPCPTAGVPRMWPPDLVRRLDRHHAWRRCSHRGDAAGAGGRRRRCDQGRRRLSPGLRREIPRRGRVAAAAQAPGREAPCRHGPRPRRGRRTRRDRWPGGRAPDQPAATHRPDAPPGGPRAVASRGPPQPVRRRPPAVHAAPPSAVPGRARCRRPGPRRAGHDQWKPQRRAHLPRRCRRPASPRRHRRRLAGPRPSHPRPLRRLSGARGRRRGPAHPPQPRLRPPPGAPPLRRRPRHRRRWRAEEHLLPGIGARRLDEPAHRRHGQCRDTRHVRKDDQAVRPDVRRR